ncbi:MULTISPECIES: DUF6146 family protein [Croceibacter]|jgi:hypothetical protein|uniref:Lipoprotein n=1 Tax=Croceibacter atlanticus (strain ATCC BAA-628 / JCM 21780 / CIP 108009 / IAM 15332 / KCTC 12090 / HTCC2559) TaxID=216432 RepID=A3UBU1_CROAH|nr:MULTISPECIES: DUF6146 family protein [Croceibacter]HAT69909.1 hypothetical protein [Flavobacteriaceae bacterium]EAP86092.1 hypothetical protein CA2559_08666 [Croceibacter atlanticus HTCC2559]MAM22630.1 hypothetical protein [Croceibacter sp.]MBG24690.1 hypothetical protein [Croceibacter sp.]WSP33769.1 DUF6146 family protein [Croceibacter atlanticus]|tara:strand:+ start:490 stop:906 length:417 start_codon:yes stop_codon:yes gene_type:complete
MKKIIPTLLLALLIIACATTNTTDAAHTDKESKTKSLDTVRIANDSLEYEIIIIEPGFQSWLVTQPPRGYYIQKVLENRNLFSVQEYNRRVLDSRYNRTNLYEQQIDYQPGIDYGYEVNYLLFNYFEFFEETYNQKLR